MKKDIPPDKYSPPGLWDLSCENQRLEGMLTVYQDHIEMLEEENEDLRAEILFLNEQLDLKSMGFYHGDPKNSST